MRCRKAAISTGAGAPGGHTLNLSTENRENVCLSPIGPNSAAINKAVISIEHILTILQLCHSCKVAKHIYKLAFLCSPEIFSLYLQVCKDYGTEDERSTCHQLK